MRLASTPSLVSTAGRHPFELLGNPSAFARSLVAEPGRRFRVAEPTAALGPGHHADSAARKRRSASFWGPARPPASARGQFMSAAARASGDLGAAYAAFIVDRAH
ncbi:unnamed protein product [Lampetra planeri]